MKKTSGALPQNDDVEGWVLTAMPRIEDDERLSPLMRLKIWMTRTGAQEKQRDHVSLLDQVARRPSSAFSAAIFDIWDAVAPEGAFAHEQRTCAALVTSLSPGVGKTTIAANLAMAAAEEGARVLLIEANPANPQLARMIELDAAPGLLDVAAQQRLIYEVQCEGEGSLHVVPILSSERRLVRRLKGRSDIVRFEGIADHFNFVAIDGPSANESDSFRQLIGAADRIALVVTAEESTEVGQYIEELDIPRRKFSGCVLSMIEPSREAA